MAREITNARQMAPDNPSGVANQFKDRLVKLIPSEIVTAYVTISGLLVGAAPDKDSPDLKTLLWIIIGILLVLTPIYLKKISGVNKKGQILFSTIGFLIWALATCSPYEDPILTLPFKVCIAIVLILYTLTIPFFYKG